MENISLLVSFVTKYTIFLKEKFNECYIFLNHSLTTPYVMLFSDKHIRIYLDKGTQIEMSHFRLSPRVALQSKWATAPEVARRGRLPRSSKRTEKELWPWPHTVWVKNKSIIESHLLSGKINIILKIHYINDCMVAM